MTNYTKRELGLWGLAATLLLCGAAFAQGAGPELAVDTYTATDGVHPGGDLRAAVVVTVPEGWHVNAHKPLDEYLIATTVEFDVPDGFSVSAMAYPEPDTFSFKGSDQTLLVYGGTFTVGVLLKVPDGATPGPYPVAGTLTYQACNDTQCWAPAKLGLTVPVMVVAPEQPLVVQHEERFADLQFAAGEGTTGQDASETPGDALAVAGATLERLDRFAIAGEAGGYMNTDEFLSFIRRAESGQGREAGDALADRGLWAMLALTLVGGLLLNLTPCVLPIIPINLAIIGAGAQSGSRARGFALGAVYGAGIALLYGALGLAVALGLSSFGAINASPWFNLFIAIVFLLLGLALFDVFLIDFTRFQSKLGVKQHKGSFLFAFIMGALNALLAGACVAPVVIAVVLYAQDAYAKGAVAALGLPFLLGVGMALPWPIAGAGLSLLPKPGKWMNHVKHAFGVFIIAMGLYYGYLGVTLVNQRYFVDREAVERSAAAMDKQGWHTSLDEALAVAEDEGKPVLVDFWATWCKNCLTMNKTTLKDQAVVQALDGYVKVKYQAEIPSESPAKDVLERFNYVGLPHYAVLTPPGAE